MTPYQIYVLIDAFELGLVPNEGTDVAEKRKLMEDGLIDLNDENRFVVTAKGEAHIRQLCRLSLPQEAWVDHNGKLL